jgi:hypothetical protein
MPTTRNRRRRRPPPAPPIVQQLVDGEPIERTEENRHRLIEFAYFECYADLPEELRRRSQPHDPTNLQKLAFAELQRWKGHT